jgi:hypothetical protein
MKSKKPFMTRNVIIEKENENYEVRR